VSAEPPAENPPPPAPPPSSIPALSPPPPAPAPLIGAGSAAEAPPAAAPAAGAEPSPQPYDPPPPRRPRFGDPGQISFDGALSASLGHTGYSESSTSLTSFNVQPALDYFSASNVSEGVSATFRYSDNATGLGSESKNVSFGVTAQFGVNLWLAQRLSFWPKLGLGALRSQTSFTPASAGGTVGVNGKLVMLDSNNQLTINIVFVQLNAPFLFHVTQHLFVGFGPNVVVDVLDSAGGVTNLRRSLGASSTVGGWF
jgi:hypothetical protein